MDRHPKATHVKLEKSDTFDSNVSTDSFADGSLELDDGTQPFVASSSPPRLHDRWTDLPAGSHHETHEEPQATVKEPKTPPSPVRVDVGLSGCPMCGATRIPRTPAKPHTKRKRTLRGG